MENVNPTRSELLYRRQQIKLAQQDSRIYALTAKRGIWLITDECYSHLLYEGMPFSVASTPGARSSVIVVGSLSKAYAMTGWRIGYALAPPVVVSAVTKLQSQSTSNPNSIAQKAAVEALLGTHESRADMLAEYRRRREFFNTRALVAPSNAVLESTLHRLGFRS